MLFIYDNVLYRIFMSLPETLRSCYSRLMPKPAHSQPRRASPSLAEGFTLGRARFAQISAVEGIALGAEARAMLRRFDEEDLSAEARRAAILGRFTPAR